MGARGNIVVHVSPTERIHVYTHWRGRDLDRFLREALRRCERPDDGGRLVAAVAAAMRDEDADDCVVTTTHIIPDFDELHVHAAARRVERVTMDWLIGSDGTIAGIEPRVVEAWPLDAFVEVSPRPRP